MRFPLISALLLIADVRGYMYDVVSTTMEAPTLCEHGCASWDTFPDALLQTLWRNVSLAKASGSSCAQPGLAVNSHLLGSWCFCKNSTQSLPPQSRSGVADPTHPFDGQTLTMLATGTYVSSGLDKYVSFSYTSAPPSMPGTESWMRATYSSMNDAMPITFHAVPSKPNTYTMFNAWTQTKGYEKWIVAQPSQTYNFLHAWGSSASDALEVTLAPQGERSGEYTMQNVADGTYVSYCTSGCDNGYWLTSGYKSLNDAMTVKLVPYVPTPPSDYCLYAHSVPEQINLQLAGPNSVTISFVTFETTAPAGKPTATFGSTPGSGTSGSKVTGGTHAYTTAAKDRQYYFHFVTLTDLKPRMRYYYTVNVDTSQRSEEFSFRAPHSHVDSGATTLDVYGDMGVYDYNNMAQLYADCVTSDTVSGIIHMGDHAYNEGESDEHRADGYMTAWQQTLANCPWVPIVGNHEYYDGAELYRFLNQSAGGRDLPQSVRNALVGRGSKKPASALGSMLSLGNYIAQGKNEDGAASHTSRFYSVDIGLIHLVALDLNGYYGDDPCGQPCIDAQKAWLAEDLAAANKNRENVPWIVAMSHYPFFCTGCFSKQTASQWYAGDGAEIYGNLNMSAAALLKHEKARSLSSCEGTTAATAAAVRAGYATSECPVDLHGWQNTVGASSDSSIKDLVEPFLQKYGVDVYLAGHWHYYETLWPASIGTTGNGGAVLQKNYNNPRVTVHVTTGNGGPPGADNFCEDPTVKGCKIASTNVQSTEFGYGRITAHNSTHFTFQQFLNINGSLFDEFTLVQDTHGPFESHTRESVQ
jgi:hypothetical protein